jgi:hypothetical protein
VLPQVTRLPLAAPGTQASARARAKAPSARSVHCCTSSGRDLLGLAEQAFALSFEDKWPEETGGEE